MESKWDLVFACRVEHLNDRIENKNLALLPAFRYKNGALTGEIPRFRIGWAGNEQYMALELLLKNVCISFGGETERHGYIRSIVHMQYAFKNGKNIRFSCSREAARRFDNAPGSLWVEDADPDGIIKSEVLQDAFPTLLCRALIENEEQISFVIAGIALELFAPTGLQLKKCVPAFQNIDGFCVFAVACMLHDTGEEPARQFSTELTKGFRYGYILRRDRFMEQFILPKMGEIIRIEQGCFKMGRDDAIVNNGTLVLKRICIAGTHYTLKADAFRMAFRGDLLHLELTGKTDFTGLKDSYISYSYHAKRRAVFDPYGIEKIVFQKTCGEDEYHCEKYIPAWIEIISSIFTFGLFTLLSEAFSSAIQEQAENLVRGISFNAGEGGYLVKWANEALRFTDGGFQENLFMRG